MLKPLLRMLKGAHNAEKPGSKGDGDGLQVTIGGEATAVGEATQTEGHVELRVVDKGPVTFATGSAKFTGAARSASEDTAYASASSFAFAEGADIVIASSSQSSRAGSHGGDALSAASSTTRIFALDIESLDLPKGPITLTYTRRPGHWSIEEPTDGNVALASVGAVAHGDSSFVGVDTSVITVEDQLSTVSAIIVGEVA
ncbi:MAG TPA: hypothetical protein VD978_25000 [Azospirillum sp.]|nr:hypothetical protein [Azospirillum sp.]